MLNYGTNYDVINGAMSDSFMA